MLYVVFRNLTLLMLKDEQAPRKIKEWSHGKIQHAFDPISEHGSTQLSAQAFGDEGGKIITLSKLQASKIPPGPLSSLGVAYSYRPRQGQR